MADLSAANHELRRTLNDEVHARPSDRISTPSRVTYLASLFRQNQPSASGDDVLLRLAQESGDTVLPDNAKHFSARYGDQQLRFERHTEFSRIAFIRRNAPDEGPFADDPMADLPREWVESIRGDLLVATRLEVVEMPPEGIDMDALSQRYFDGNLLVGALIAGRHAVGLTDFRIAADGFGRILLLNEAMTDAQAGRYAQRLLELETYRMMALLALPVAQSLMPELDAGERELASINESLVSAEPSDESELLDRLTQLAARNQGRLVASGFRFAAADAYYALVLQRTEELREERIPGTQTFSEFTTRRLTPAIKTCRAVASRQESLVQRLARATQLLSTRVDVERQGQNQSILASVNRRLKSQLRLQATVEGLSVAAVTYYVVGLIGLVAGGLEDKGMALDATVVTAVSVPLVAGLTYYAIRRVRRGLNEDVVE